MAFPLMEEGREEEVCLELSEKQLQHELDGDLLLLSLQREALARLRCAHRDLAS